MLKEIFDKTEWDKLHGARTTASGHFLQSWEWGEFQKSFGRKVIRLADENGLAQAIEMPLPFGKKYWFCPKGPIGFDKAAFKDLSDKAKIAGAVFVRVEPGEKIDGVKTIDISPARTSVVDLAKSEDELLAAMHPKTRYNIRVAERHGVKIERHHGTAGIIDELIELFLETAKRDGFHLHPVEYYKKQLAAFGEKKDPETGARPPHIVVFAARADGKMLAAAIVMFDPSTALGAGSVTYLHGASSNESRNVMAPYAMHWAIMKRAKERGYKTYDLWGISDDPKSGWSGITRFKRGWGGDDLCAPGTYDLPMNNFWYNLYRLARRILASR